MATIILGAAGAAIGGSLGGGALGLSSVLIGRAVGATLGRVVDQSVLGAGSEPVEAARVDRFRVSGAGEGGAVAQVFGRMRVGGQVIWCSKFREHVSTMGGGKGAPAQPEVNQYSYSVSLALALCEGRIARVGRIWADGQEIECDSIDCRVYSGDEAQLPDPVMEAVEGAGNVPAYRGLAYVVIEHLDLGRFGNRVPQFNFEVIRPEQGAGEADLSAQVRAVAMMPGTGEYALATTPVRYETGPGVSQAVNVHTPSGKTDFATSLDDLTGELPRCGAASLIVSWFGDDLRCGTCRIRPKVEQNQIDPNEMPWRAGGLARKNAPLIPRMDGEVIYGGTPSDASVVEAIVALREAGQHVMFYPFVLMEQLAGNALPDPYGAAEQPPLPWRGRITLAEAPGRAGSADGTAAAEADVAAFFGAADAGDSRDAGGAIVYEGPEDWGYRRFILHYAHLCRLAGGVESFCVGSELRGLTRIRGAAGFPAVEALRRLAADVRAILGPEVKISYAADWSEYFGYHPQDGSGDVYFHLDPLWADPNIDFVGIDNYMPLSDWRDGEDHADAGHGSVYALDYLKGNVMGGEGFEWYYRTPEDEAAQRRTPITDGAHDEPWVYRYKDLKSWWSQPHHNRIGGERAAEPTSWVPCSKPIWFTEIGCAAIDKGTNEPNKFLDPKSSESALPKFSNGQRDDFMQVQYLRAHAEFWSDARNNSISTLYGGAMIDLSRSFVWAWDVRPFPAFPGLPEVWSDSGNYARGHWLTGRSSSRALSSVVREICAASHVEAVDADALCGVVRGFGINEIGSARAALQPLMLAYGFDAVEREGKLIFRSRTGRATEAVSPDSVAVSRDLGGDMVALRNPDAERVGRVKLNFVGADGDFQIRTAGAQFPDERSFGVSQSDLPLVLTGGEARAITERWLAETRIARDRMRFALPPSRIGLGAGDVVSIGRERYRMDHVEQAEFLQIDAVRIGADVYEPVDGRDDRVRIEPYAPASPPATLFLDLPLLTGDEVPHAPHVAAAARPWSRAAVHSSADDAGYRFDLFLDRPALIGVTRTPLSTAGPGLYDRGAPLRVELVRGALASVSETQLFAGANAMAIGSGKDDVWEVFQFRDAALVGPRVYELSYRLRGQAGSDALIPSFWPAGSFVVLLDEAVRQIGYPKSQRGLARHYRTGPASKPIGDATYRHEVRAFEGIGLRPYAPVHLRAAEANGDLIVTWTRRTRIDGDNWQGADVPLGEEVERYLVRVLRDGLLLRETETREPAWTYTAAERAADGAGAGLEIEVAQISTTFGPGLFRRLSLD